jgi:hypothetical protein
MKGIYQFLIKFELVERGFGIPVADFCLSEVEVDPDLNLDQEDGAFQYREFHLFHKSSPVLRLCIDRQEDVPNVGPDEWMLFLCKHNQASQQDFKGILDVISQKLVAEGAIKLSPPNE